MAAHSFIEIVGGPRILTCREGYIPDLATLFTESDLRCDEESYGYVSTVGGLRDRLQLRGLTEGRARAQLDEQVRVWHERCRPSNPPAFGDLGVELLDSSTIMSEFDRYVKCTPSEWIPYDEPDVFSQLDARTVLRLALDLIKDDPRRSVRYDLDDLQSFGLLEPGSAITKLETEKRQTIITADAPLVILTEGSSDADLLAEAIEVTHPHLVGFVNFMDFGFRTEGGAASLAKQVRSFAGAGIANRVLALADNDTAAYDALHKLKKSVQLPANIRVMHYPPLPLLEQYPTLESQTSADPVLMDVNGTAGSLEMYLGCDVLTHDNALIPVVWKGRVEGQGQDQGAISPVDKRRVQAAFRKKVKTALDDPTERGRQDWTGIEAIVKVILNAFNAFE